MDSVGVARRQRGQGSLELLGIVVVAAIMVGAAVLAITQSGPHVTATIRTKICEITTVGQGDCGSPPDVAPEAPGESGVPTYVDPSLTPQQRAESGRYVALGDSFSSGEGGSEFDPRTDENYAGESEEYWNTHDENGEPTTGPVCAPVSGQCYTPPEEDPYHNMCHRSTQAYPQHVNEDFAFADGWTFAACSGAVTDDFYRPNSSDPERPWKGNDGEIPQLENLDESTSLVTFTIGGNDAKFSETLTGCIKAGVNPFDSCTDDDEKQEVDDNISTALDHLEELLPKVRDKSPNARIRVLGYPRFFPEDPGSEWGDGTQIDHDDILFINSKVKDMDQQIHDLVDQLNEQNPGNFEYVDTYDAFRGCEIGTDDSCMNNITVRLSDGQPDKNGSYHPNDQGHGRLAELVDEQVRSGE